MFSMRSSRLSPTCEIVSRWRTSTSDCNFKLARQMSNRRLSDQLRLIEAASVPPRPCAEEPGPATASSRRLPSQLGDRISQHPAQRVGMPRSRLRTSAGESGRAGSPSYSLNETARSKAGSWSRQFTQRPSPISNCALVRRSPQRMHCGARTGSNLGQAVVADGNSRNISREECDRDGNRRERGQKKYFAGGIARP